MNLMEQSQGTIMGILLAFLFLLAFILIPVPVVAITLIAIVTYGTVTTFLKVLQSIKRN